MTDKNGSTFLLLARQIADRYSSIPQVEAVVMSGSQSSGVADEGSDIDLYVYTQTEIPVGVRAEIAAVGSEQVEVDNRFWEPSDQWIDARTGIYVDVMFRSVQWVEEQLDRVLKRYEASLGYSTCIWHNVLSAEILYDPNGWFQALQRAADRPYPEPLRRAIIAKNYPVLRQNMSSYLVQLEQAVARGDLVSVNHRLAALLASYFDLLFAFNRLPHPGEKRLVTAATGHCARLPKDMSAQVNGLLQAVSRGDQQVIGHAEQLIDGLDFLLSKEE
jgi:hypothetical protein